jgi:hypothetical protein
MSLHVSARSPHPLGSEGSPRGRGLVASAPSMQAQPIPSSDILRRAACGVTATTLSPI